MSDLCTNCGVRPRTAISMLCRECGEQLAADSQPVPRSVPAPVPNVVSRTILAALAGGATIMLEPRMPGKPYAVASARWPDEPLKAGTRIKGDLGLSAASALDSLESELLPLSAAQRMREIIDAREAGEEPAPRKEPAEGHTIEARTFYDRREDMSADGKLTLLVEDDGDIIVQVVGQNVTGEMTLAAVQFCTVGSGGGRSPNVRRALRELILAIQADNEETPIPD